MNEDELAEESDGEGYFASISDLMVGVLFVFLLMLTVLALNFRDDSARLDELIAQLAQAKQAAQTAQAEAERQMEIARASQRKRTAFVPRTKPCAFGFRKPRRRFAVNLPDGRPRAPAYCGVWQKDSNPWYTLHPGPAVRCVAFIRCRTVRAWEKRPD